MSSLDEDWDWMSDPPDLHAEQRPDQSFNFGLLNVGATQLEVGPQCSYGRSFLDGDGGLVFDGQCTYTEVGEVSDRCYASMDSSASDTTASAFTSMEIVSPTGLLEEVDLERLQEYWPSISRDKSPPVASSDGKLAYKYPYMFPGILTGHASSSNAVGAVPALDSPEFRTYLGQEAPPVTCCVRPSLLTKTSQDTKRKRHINRPRSLRKEQRKLDKPERCQMCSHRTAWARDLNRHYWVHHPVTAKALGIPLEDQTCRHCQRVFRKDNLKRHLKNKHGHG